MDLQLAPGDGPDGEGPGPGEMMMLGAVRLASLPFLLLVIVLAALIYSVAGLARGVAMLAAIGSRRPGGVARSRGRPVKAHDA